MTLITVEQAAERLKRTPRTIRRWIEKDKKLTEYHPPHGHKTKYLIDTSEVERLEQELAQFEQAEPPAAATEDRDSLLKKVEHLEHWLQDIQNWHAKLEKRIEALERGTIATIAPTEPTEPTAAETHVPTRTATKRATAPTEAPIDLPPGSILASDFARKYGVNARTFRDHIVAGMRKTGRRVEAIERDKPNRPGEREYWLSPEQQEQAIAFWQAHNVRFAMPTEEDQATAEASLQEAHSADFSASDL